MTASGGRQPMPNPSNGVRRCPWMRDGRLHPAWRQFLEYCADLRYGEIERLKIQDGLPVLAEVTRQKVRFGGAEAES